MDKAILKTPEFRQAVREHVRELFAEMQADDQPENGTYSDWWNSLDEFSRVNVLDKAGLFIDSQALPFVNGDWMNLTAHIRGNIMLMVKAASVGL